MTHKDHNETGCCGCFSWLFTRHKRRADPEDDGILPEATLSTVEDTLGQGPHCPAPPTEVEPPGPEAEVEPHEPQLVVELPQPDAEVEHPEPQLEVELPQPDVEVEHPEPQLEVEHPEPQLEVELPQPDAEVEHPEPQLEVELPQPEAEVEHPEPQLEVELPQPEAEVEHLEPQLEVEPPQSEAEVELPQPEVEVEPLQSQLEVEPPEPEAEVEPPEPQLEIEPPEPQLEIEPREPFPEADTVRKCVRFHFDNLHGFVKDREMYGGLAYCRYGVPLSVIRSQPYKAKQSPARPQKGPVSAPQGVHNTPRVFTAARCTNCKAQLQKSLPRQDRRPMYTGPRLVGYYLDSSSPVRACDQHRAYNGYCRGRYYSQGYYDDRHGGQGHNYRIHYF